MRGKFGIMVCLFLLAVTTANAGKIGAIIPGAPGCWYIPGRAIEACGAVEVADCWGGPVAFAGQSSHPGNWRLFWEKDVDRHWHRERLQFFNDSHAVADTEFVPVEIPGQISVVRATLHVQFVGWEEGGWFEVAFDGKGCT